MTLRNARCNDEENVEEVILFGPNEDGGIANNEHTIYCQSTRSSYFDVEYIYGFVMLGVCTASR